MHVKIVADPRGLGSYGLMQVAVSCISKAVTCAHPKTDVFNILKGNDNDIRKLRKRTGMVLKRVSEP